MIRFILSLLPRKRFKVHFDCANPLILKNEQERIDFIKENGWEGIEIITYLFMSDRKYNQLEEWQR